MSYANKARDFCQFFIYEHLFKVSFDDSDRLPDGVLGRTYFEKAEIILRPGMSIEVTDITLTHELVHAFLMAQGRWGQSKFTDEEVCEFVAWNGTKIQSLRRSIMNTLFEINKEDPA